MNKLDRFCRTKNMKDMRGMEIDTIKLFVKVSVYCIKKGKGDVKLAKKIVAKYSDLLSERDKRDIEERKRDEDFTACSIRKLGKYKLSEEIGHGFVGVAYEVCRINNCDYVLKVEQLWGDRKENTEGQIGKKAGEMNIGPKVYDYGICKNKGGDIVNWVLMEKVTGKTLSKMYPYDPRYIVEALEKYYKLAKAGTPQRDLKGDNIMITPSGRLYILDYGMAMEKFPTEEELKKHMSAIANLLINSLTSKFGEYSTSENLWIQDDSESRSKVYRDITEAATSWYQKTFNTKSNILPSYNMEDFENKKREVSQTMEKWINKHYGGF